MPQTDSDGHRLVGFADDRRLVHRLQREEGRQDVRAEEQARTYLVIKKSGSTEVRKFGSTEVQKSGSTEVQSYA